MTGGETELIARIRELVSLIPANNEDDLSYMDCDDDLNRVCADLKDAAADPAVALPIDIRIAEFSLRQNRHMERTW